MSEQIIKAEYSELMQKSYIDYAMSVICARALPDVRDGLKPVQRRVLFAMDELGLNYDKPHRKSARIVGDTMGKYHPHGDSSIYDALVVMSQDFKKGMALVNGHGNFGSIEGDGAAAMRYTEAKLMKFTQDVYLKDLDKNTVDFVPNFDETEKEPSVLPVRIPNFLVNGSEGIAVGMTTSVPPHNLAEVIDAECYYMDHPRASTEDLMQFIQGPDFPTGGIVINKSELASIYSSGTGKIKVRGKVEFEKGKKGEKDRLVITEIPYTMIGNNIGKFLSDVVSLVEEKKTTDIVDISNASSKDGIRIVLELKKNTDVERLKNLLYKKTKLEDTFGVNMLAVVNGRPETLSLRRVLEEHYTFLHDITTRKYNTLLNKLYDEKEINEGLITACDCIDLIIEILRGSKDVRMAKRCLIHGKVDRIRFKSEESKAQAAELHFTERQATAILEMRLSRLIGLEILALKKKYEELLKKIAEYEDILNNPKSMKRTIKKDLQDIKKEYSFERKTVVEDGAEAVFEEAPIVEQQVYFIMDRFGYSKTIDVNTYNRNTEAVLKDYRMAIPCKNTEKLCIFTDVGVMHQLKVLDIPSGRLRDKGTPIDNLCGYDSAGENIISIFASSELDTGRFLFVSARSLCKTVTGTEFFGSRKTMKATKVNDNDRVIYITKIDETIKDQYIVLESRDGYFLRFPISLIPEQKKTAAGVRGMKLSEQDEIHHVYLPMQDQVTAIEFNGKTVNLNQLKIASRDGKGTKRR